MLTKPAESPEQKAFMAEVITCQKNGTKKDDVKATKYWAIFSRRAPINDMPKYVVQRRGQESREYEAA